MSLAGSADDAAKLSAVQQMWSQVGVTMKIQQLENATKAGATSNAGHFQMRDVALDQRHQRSERDHILSS